MLDKNKIVSESGTSLQELPKKHTERVRVQTLNKEPSMAQQQYKDETDINNIIKRHGGADAAYRALARGGGVYADFSNLSDYQTMLHEVSRAQEAFLLLPAELRARFRNDPGELLQFVQNSSNYDEAVSLGLVEPKPPKPAAPSKNESNDKTEAAPKTPKS